MNFFFSHATPKKMKDEPEEHPLVIHETPHNTSDGSEFLDDAIRIEEQPLPEEENPETEMSSDASVL